MTDSTSVAASAQPKTIPGEGDRAKSSAKGYLMVLGAAACWATSGVLLKQILVNYDPTPLTLAFWRDFLTFIVLFSSLVLFRRDLLRVERRERLFSCLAPVPPHTL